MAVPLRDGGPVALAFWAFWSTLAQGLWRPLVWILRRLPLSGQRFWRSIPKYLPFYLLVLIVGYAGYYGRRPALVILPFQLPAEKAAGQLPFSGETAANLVQDALVALQTEARGGPQSRCRVPEKERLKFGGLKGLLGTHVHTPSQVTVEVKGISVAAVISLAREVLQRERLVSGDVVLAGPGSFRLVARTEEEGPWETGPHPVTGRGLDQATCDLAEKILRGIDPNLYGVLLIRRKDYSAAIKIYRGVSHASRNSPDTLNNLGVALRELKRYEEAETNFIQALQLQPKFPEAHYNLGVALSDKRQLEEAMVEYKKAIALQPDYAEAHYDFGNALYDKKRLDEAIVEYTKAIAFQPDLAQAHNNLGNALRDTKKVEEAIAEYKRAIELEPDYAIAHNNLGEALSHKKQPDEAIAEYKIAIGLKADYANAHYNLGLALSDKKQVDKAIAEYRKAIALQPNYADFHRSLALALRHTGRTREAALEFEKYKNLSSATPR